MPRPAKNIAAAMVAAWNAGNPARILELAPHAGAEESGSEDVLLLLGLAEQATGRHGDAAITFRRLTTLRPGVSAYWNNLGVACREAGQLAAAEEALSTAQALAPRDAEVKYNLGLLRLEQRRWAQAREILLDAVALEPGFIEARLQAAHACYICGDNTGQQSMLASAADWPAQDAEQALVLATMLSVQGELGAALDALDKAILPPAPAADTMRLRLSAQRAALYERNNQLERASQELRQLPLAMLEHLPPEASQARMDGWRAHAALAMREGDLAAAAALNAKVLALADNDETIAGANFGLAAALDRQGLHAQAWAALCAAHAAQLNLAREVTPELATADSQPLPIAAHTVDLQSYARWSTPEAPDAAHSPVFVVGFPRSGTTLLEQMLDAHADFASMDERAFIHELTERMALAGQKYPQDLATLTHDDVAQLRALYFSMVANALPERGSRRLVDKNPLNMLCLPMIMRLFPKARIILCLRHPCDVLLSCSMQPFRSPAFMVLCSSLQRLAQGYVRAFEYWHGQAGVFAPHVLEWRYESVVSNFDAEVARLGRFLDVADTSAMTRFAEHARNKQFISTPSYAQVTEALYRKRVGRWEAYREQFASVLPVLQPWLERLGYEA
ncbi:MAG: sulfotransferase [Xanthomonadales bacterium]|nr:sulfotransferase [Xanthomonadales bacterium]